MMKLVDNWKQSWKWLTMQVGVVAVVWATLPLDMQTAVLHFLGVAPEKVPGILGAAILVGRLIDQSKPQAQLPAEESADPPAA